MLGWIHAKTIPIGVSGAVNPEADTTTYALQIEKYTVVGDAEKPFCWGCNTQFWGRHIQQITVLSENNIS